jgi:hypothetical protein
VHASFGVQDIPNVVSGADRCEATRAVLASHACNSQAVVDANQVAYTLMDRAGKLTWANAFSSCRAAKNTDGDPPSAHLSLHDSLKASANPPRYLACRHLARPFRASLPEARGDLSFVQRRAVWYLVPRIQHESCWLVPARVSTLKASPPYRFVPHTQPACHSNQASANSER